MVWEKVPLDPHEIREFARKLGTTLLTSSVMLRRKMTESPGLLFLMEDAPRFLHNPFLFEDMGKAVDRINQAMSRGEKTMIFGDRDVDGITATVTLVEAFEQAGGQAGWLLPKGDEEYGLTAALIDRFAAEGVKLLITVDCGISNVEEIRRAREQGIDTIVADHHNPPAALPPALAIINPKLADSRYPFREIAGCTVVAKLAWALFFSRTPLYGQEVCLLNVRPVNEGCEIEAVKLVNLVERERLAESFIQGLADWQRSRMRSFLGECDVQVFDLPLQQRMLERMFGPLAGVRFTDVRARMCRCFPHITGKSLLKIKEVSRIARFQPRRFGELDMLVNLYVSMIHKEEEAFTSELQRYMDLVTLGTLADLMPLADENRILVRRGLEELNKLKRPGLRALVVRQNLHGRKLNTVDIAWQITPVLNSAGRMGEPEVAARLLFTRSPEEAELLVDALLELNRRRKGLGDQVWDRVLKQARESLEKSGGRFVLVADKGINRGITGLIAARLVGAFRVPAIAAAVSEDRVVGSLRSPYRVDQFLDRFPGLLASYGGHDLAAGFSMVAANLEAFQRRFYQVVEELLLPDAQEEKILVDAELPHRYLNPDLIKVVDFFEPFGEGNPPLVFLARKVKIESIETMGRREENHLKLTVAAGKYRWPAVCWRAAERGGMDFKVDDRVDIVFRLSRNYYESMENLRLTILDLHRCES
jgi:single-stranded-DNA-specific exonuclease